MEEVLAQPPGWPRLSAFLALLAARGGRSGVRRAESAQDPDLVEDEEVFVASDEGSELDLREEDDQHCSEDKNLLDGVVQTEQGNEDSTSDTSRRVEKKFQEEDDSEEEEDEDNMAIGFGGVRVGIVSRLSRRWSRRASGTTLSPVQQEQVLHEENEQVPKPILKRLSNRLSNAGRSEEDAEERPPRRVSFVTEEGELKEKESKDEASLIESDHNVVEKGDSDDEHYEEEEKEEKGDVEEGNVEKKEAECVATSSSSSPQTNIQRLIAMFKSGAVSRKDFRVERESLLRLQRGNRRVRKHTKRRPESKLHEWTTPTDEFKMNEAAANESENGNEPPEDETAGRPPNKETERPRGSLVRRKLNKLKTMRTHQKCPLCEKAVYKMEKLTDSKDRPFHYYCIKCKDCHRALVGENTHIMVDENGKRTLTCDKHFHLRTKGPSGLVKGWRPKNPSVNHGGQFEDDIEGGRNAIRRSLVTSLGRKPLCSRCGGEIALSDEDFIVSGLERMHAKCPEEADVKKTPRHFVLAAESLQPLHMRVGKKVHSFLFKLKDQEEKSKALSRHRLAAVSLLYVPDEDAKTDLSKILPAEDLEEERLTVSDARRTFAMENRHPLSGKMGNLCVDHTRNLIYVQLFKEECNVVHGLNAAFTFEEEGDLVNVLPLAMEITFEVLEVTDYAGGSTELTEAERVCQDDFLERILVPV